MIKEIGLTGNFKEKTNEFIKNFEFNPTILYISRNELTSFKPLEKFKFKRLTQFWSTDNKIKNLNELLYLNSKTVKLINLKNNLITNIDNIEKIVEHFPKLEKLILTNRYIDKKYFKEKIDQIKAKNKNFHLEIIY